jgi:hypothetical protein
VSAGEGAVSAGRADDAPLAPIKGAQNPFEQLWQAQARKRRRPPLSPRARPRPALLCSIAASPSHHVLQTRLNRGGDGRVPYVQGV